jgi:hypothetical protein
VSDVIPTNPEQRPQTRGRTTNGFAVASLVLGIVWAMGVGSILALVFGYLAKSQIDRSPDEETGRGMAIAGIVLGWVGVGFLVLMIVSAWTGWMGMGGDMMGGDMMGSDMMGGDMMGSDMMGSDMMGSDMMGSDMMGSDMMGGGGHGH